MSDETTKPMSYKEAAIEVLRKYANKKPMHYQKIVNVAISKGWLAPLGLTPGATLTAVIGEENKQRKARGEYPRFSVVGGGFYGLTEWQQSPAALEAATQKIQKIEEQLLSYLRYKIAPYRFEEVIAFLLEKMGFVKVQHVGKSGDGGIDVEAELIVLGLVTFKTIIQVKRYSYNVAPKYVRELKGTDFQDGTQPDLRVLITTSSFAKKAIQEAEKSAARIRLIDGKELAKLMVDNEVGVQRQTVTTTVATLVEDFFEPPAVDVQTVSTELEEQDAEMVTSNTGSSHDEPATKNKTELPEGLALSAKFKNGQVIEATVKKNNHVLYNGVDYGSPSAAGKAATGWMQCNGWTFWQYQDHETGEWALLDVLRRKQL